MPDLTIIDRKVYFDRQLVAELHPSLVEGTTLHWEFLALLRAGARAMPGPLLADLVLTGPIAAFEGAKKDAG